LTGANLQGAILSDVDLNGANLAGVQMPDESFNLINSKLDLLSFTGRNLN
jgi:uncharacterized protein YjbI with pentapeptide repeats